MCEIAFVADEQYGHLFGALDAHDLIPHCLYVAIRSMTRYRIDDNESVSILDV
jgi:hypothetical protein